MTTLPHPNSEVNGQPQPEPVPRFTFCQKWGDDPFTAHGHTQTPNALIDYGAGIGLSMSECWLITCILKFKHSPEDPYPSQAKLAAIVGKDDETIRRIIKAIEKKSLLVIHKVRGEMGQFTHSVYDFAPLRAALNAAYYADHPKERPISTPPNQATVQKCTVGQPPCKNGANHRAKTADTTVQKRAIPPCRNEGLIRVLNQSPEEENKEENPTRREPQIAEPVDWNALDWETQEKYRLEATTEILQYMTKDGLVPSLPIIEGRARNLYHATCPQRIR